MDRRLRHFSIHYIDTETTSEEVLEAVDKELDGPGQCLGYQSMNQKLRTEHNIKVPRHVVHNVIRYLNPDGIENRKVSKKRKKKKQPFVSDGPDWVYSFDGHDKLMGYQNWTFPVVVYGCLDTFSHHMRFIFVWNSNSDPLIIGQ